MALNVAEKQQIIASSRVHATDTGSSAVQISILTARINQLTQHLKTHKHDYHTRRGLMKLVGRRRRLLAYLGRHNPQLYRELIERLGLRTKRQ